MAPNGSQETPVVQGLRQCKQHVGSLDSSLQAVTVLADASSPLEVRGADREMERGTWASVAEYHRDCLMAPWACSLPHWLTLQKVKFQASGAVLGNQHTKHTSPRHDLKIREVPSPASALCGPRHRETFNQEESPLGLRVLT